MTNKLGVDARMMIGSWQHRGIGRYTADLLRPINKEDIIAFLPGSQTHEKFNTISEGISFFPLWEQLVLPGVVRKKGLTHMLYPCITSPLMKSKKVKNIVVIYDLIFMEPFSKLPWSKSNYNNFGRLYRRFMVPSSLKSGNSTLVSISEYSKQQVHERFGIPLERMLVIPCSLSSDWYTDKYISNEERGHYLLTVAGDAPSKNLKNIITAFSQAVNNPKFKHFKLRIIGVGKASRGPYLDLISSLEIKDNVVFEDFVSHEDLKILFRNAWASLTLSLLEGFGIPVIEAMASGTPVVCSNITSLPEVSGNAAIFADPTKVSSMTDAMKEVLEMSPAQRNELSEKGILNARKYDFKVVSEKIKAFWADMGLVNY